MTPETCAMFPECIGVDWCFTPLRRRRGLRAHFSLLFRLLLLPPRFLDRPLRLRAPLCFGCRLRAHQHSLSRTQPLMQAVDPRDISARANTSLLLRAREKPFGDLLSASWVRLAAVGVHDYGRDRATQKGEGRRPTRARASSTPQGTSTPRVAYSPEPRWE